MRDMPRKRGKSPPDPFFPKNLRECGTADLESSRKRDFPVGDKAARGFPFVAHGCKSSKGDFPSGVKPQGGFPFAAQECGFAGLSRNQAARGICLWSHAAGLSRRQATRGMSVCGSPVRLRRPFSPVRLRRPFCRKGDFPLWCQVLQNPA